MVGHALRILIVEDHLLIAKQVEVIATSAGHIVVGTAADADSACAIADAANPDVVFLDISLAGAASGLDVASLIARASSAHVVFTTANRRRLPQDFGGAVGVVEKPFTRVGLLSAIRYIASRLRQPDASLVAPACLQLSPAYAARWQQPNCA